MDIIPVFGTVVGGSNPSGGTKKRSKKQGERGKGEDNKGANFDLYSQ
jgi:hypothetical protein